MNRNITRIRTRSPHTQDPRSNTSQIETRRPSLVTPLVTARASRIYFWLIVYAVVVKTALEPVKGSVPAPTLCRIWLEGRPWLLRR